MPDFICFRGVINCHDIKPAIEIIYVDLLQKSSRDFANLFLLGNCNPRLRSAKLACSSRFHLDKNDDLFNFADNINFTSLSPKIARYYFVTF